MAGRLLPQGADPAGREPLHQTPGDPFRRAGPMAPDASPDPAPEASAPLEPAPAPSAVVTTASPKRVVGAGRAGAASGSTRAAGSGPLATLREVLDRLLVADVFLVLAGAAWFALAVLLHSRGVDAPLRLFQKLWQPLFTPAIGLLMAAALLSGALGWWQRRGLGGARGTGS